MSFVRGHTYQLWTVPWHPRSPAELHSALALCTGRTLRYVSGDKDVISPPLRMPIDRLEQACVAADPAEALRMTRASLERTAEAQERWAAALHHRAALLTEALQDAERDAAVRRAANASGQPGDVEPATAGGGER